MEVVNPELAKEWHYQKNYSLLHSEVAVHSNLFSDAVFNYIYDVSGDSVEVDLFIPCINVAIEYEHYKHNLQ